MFKELLNKENYFFEFQKLLFKSKASPSLLNKAYLNKEVSLRWVLYNKDFIINNIIKLLKKDQYQIPTAIETCVATKTKQRYLYAFDWHEKIFQAVLSNVLSKFFETLYTENLKSYRKGKGTYSTLKELISYLLANDNDNYYLIKTDISSYGDSIDHNELLLTLNKYIPDNKLINIIEKILQFNYISYQDKQMHKKEIGLPTGSAINNVLTNIFLNDLDWEIVNNINNGRYYRYGDDIFFISKEESEFNFVKEKILANINEKKLKINKEKFNEFYIEKNDNNIVILKYLGFNIDFNRQVISLTKEKDLELRKEFVYFTRRIILNYKFENFSTRQRLKILIRNYRKFLLKTEILSRFLSYFGIVNDKIYWKNLDIWIASYLSSKAYKVALRKGFKKVPFKLLRAYKLPSLVHLKRIYTNSNLKKVYKYLS